MTSTIIPELDNTYIATNDPDIGRPSLIKDSFQKSDYSKSDEKSEEPSFIYSLKKQVKQKSYGIWQMTVSLPNASLFTRMPEHVLHTDKEHGFVSYQIKDERLHFTFSLGSLNQNENILQQIRRFFFEIFKREKDSYVYNDSIELNEFLEEYHDCSEKVLKQMVMEQLSFYFDFRIRIPRAILIDQSERTSALILSNLLMAKHWGKRLNIFSSPTQKEMMIKFDENDRVCKPFISVQSRIILPCSAWRCGEDGLKILENDGESIFSFFRRDIEYENQESLKGLQPYVPFIKGSRVLVKMSLPRKEKIPKNMPLSFWWRYFRYLANIKLHTFRK